MVFSLGSFDGLTNIFILSKKIFRDLVATKNYHFVSRILLFAFSKDLVLYHC